MNDPNDTERWVWVLHRPTTDRRTGKTISLDVVRHMGKPRVLLTMSETADNYEDAAREMYEALDEFADGDVVCSLGGDLHSVTMLDDMLRQRGVEHYVWAKHLGHGTYREFPKHLVRTDFSAVDSARR